MNIIFPIIILAAASYLIGVKSVYDGKYKPSVYSRLIWALISINSFIGVLALHNGVGTISLAGVQFLGSLAMFLFSLKYSVKTFGKTELICSVLLVVSVFVWLIARSPIINVFISLVAHFIGGAPTFIHGWKKPKSENFLFWFLFAAASVLAFINADKADFKGFVYALYFMLFDSIMTLISSRQFLKK